MGDGQARAPVPIPLFCPRLHPSESSHCAWPSAGRKAKKSFGASGLFQGSSLQAAWSPGHGDIPALICPGSEPGELRGEREERGRAPR